MTPDEALRSFNDAISKTPEIDLHGPVQPMLFICGAPRSGTTFVYQALTHAGRFGCITNLVARFIDNPPLGIRLAQALSLPSEFTGESKYGRTQKLTEPHEFGRGWLKILDAKGLAENDAPARISGTSLEAIEKIARAWQRPTVFKSFAYLWHIKALSQGLPSSVWLHLEREPDANAASLLRLYESRGVAANQDAWLSAVCNRTVEASVGALDLRQRCRQQVADLNAHIESDFFQIPEPRRLSVKFEDFVASPRKSTQVICEQFGLDTYAENLAEIPA